MIVSYDSILDTIDMWYYDQDMTLQRCWIGPRTLNSWSFPVQTRVHSKLQNVRSALQKATNIEILEDTGDL